MAKATDSVGVRRMAKAKSLHSFFPGYRCRHDSTGECGTGEILLGGQSGEAVTIRRELKGNRAGRKSEGLIVPEKVVKATGGRGPCGERAGARISTRA